MGCWTETCAVTNTAINSNQECVIVRIKEDPTYLMRAYGYYPNIQSLEHVRDIIMGSYNDYGYVNEDDRDIDFSDDEYRIFFHRKVWDSLAKMGKKEVSTTKWETINTQVPIELLKQFAAVALVALLARRNILANIVFTGSQSWSPEIQAKIARLAAPIIRANIEEYGGMADEW